MEAPAGGQVCALLLREEARSREVGCQWESPEEEEKEAKEARKEVGCQSDGTETKDAGVQVDLLTQQLSWRHSDECFCADGPKRKRMSGDHNVSRTKSEAADSLTNHSAGKPAHQKAALMENDDWSRTNHHAEKLQSSGSTGQPTEIIQRTQDEGRRDAGAGRVREKGEVKSDTEQARRPRRTRVGPPIRYLVEYEEQSHGLSAANHSRERGAKVKKKQGRMRRASQGDRWRHHGQVCGLSLTSCASLQLHNKLEQEADGQGDWLRNMSRATRSPRWWVDYWIVKKRMSRRRTRRREELDLWRQVKRKRCRETEEEQGKRVCVGDLGEGLMVERRRRDERQGKEEEPQRPRRRLVGPPIRYLLESEEPSHGPVMAHRTNQNVQTKIKSCVRTPIKVFSHKKARGGASETDKRPKAAEKLTGHMTSERQMGHMTSETLTGHMISKGKTQDEERRRIDAEQKEEEQPQRRRRRMVSPPIRYLLESEEPSHGPVVAHRTNQNVEKAQGGASEMIDRTEAAERLTGHVVPDTETSLYRWTYLAHRDLQSGQVTIISPSCVMLERIL